MGACRRALRHRRDAAPAQRCAAAEELGVEIGESGRARPADDIRPVRLPHYAVVVWGGTQCRDRPEHRRGCVRTTDCAGGNRSRRLPRFTMIRKARAVESAFASHSQYYPRPDRGAAIYQFREGRRAPYRVAETRTAGVRAWKQGSIKANIKMDRRCDRVWTFVQASSSAQAQLSTRADHAGDSRSRQGGGWSPSTSAAASPTKMSRS